MSFNFEESTTESVKYFCFYILFFFFLLKKFKNRLQLFGILNRNLVIAGTYSGQIVMWDIRSNKQTPIQRSSLSITSHVVILKKIYFFFVLLYVFFFSFIEPGVLYQNNWRK